MNIRAFAVVTHFGGVLILGTIIFSHLNTEILEMYSKGMIIEFVTSVCMALAALTVIVKIRKSICNDKDYTENNEKE